MNKEGGSTLTIRKSNHVTDGFKGYKATLFAGEMSYTEINIPLRKGDDLSCTGTRMPDVSGISAEARYCCSAVTDCLPVMTTASIYLPKKGDRRMKKRMIILFMALLSLSVTSKAQWAVIDPTNLAQGIVNSANEIVQTSTTAQNM